MCASALTAQEEEGGAGTDAACLLLAYKTLYWMESEDPGGIVFSQRMMQQDAETVVGAMLRELQVSSSEPLNPTP
jgi:hypothetical protein